MPRARYQFDKMTDEVVSELCRVLDGGLRREDAAVLAGIGLATFKRWRAAREEIEQTIERAQAGVDLGEEGAKPHVPNKHEARVLEVFARIDMAELGGEDSALSKIRGSDDWKAHAWLLKNRYPEKYGDRQQVTMRSEGPPPMMIFMGPAHPELAKKDEAEKAALEAGDGPRPD